MPTNKEIYTGWRDNAHIDWFSQFVKAWIPFNAWLSHSWGDKSDKELLEHLKQDANSVKNKIVPILTWQSSPSGKGQNWADSTPEANDFRRNVALLSQHLQSNTITGRKGKVCFEQVDVGANANKDEQKSYDKLHYRVRRDYPQKPQVLVEVVDSKGVHKLNLQQAEHDRAHLEADAGFLTLSSTAKAQVRNLYDLVKPRLVVNALCDPSDIDSVKIEGTHFTNDQEKLYCALVDVIYGLRNALFHGSITPTVDLAEVYEPAYHIVMRFVRCTI